MQTKQRVKLQRERERQNLSQEEVAAAIGATVRSISRWEQGESTPKPYYRMRLCELFHKKADELDLEPLEADLEFVEPENAFYDPMIPPRPSLQLIGREYILQQIKFALLQNRDVAIFGMAGIGKSALAVALAYDQDVRLHFSGGILWEALGPAPDVAHTLARWKTQLSPTSPPFTKKMTLRDMARDVRMSITQSRLLVVIDDAWDLKNALTLHALGANCTHLTTTRLSDVAFYLARHPYVVELEELSEVESMSLLQSLAPAVIQEQQRTQQLVRIVGGHPLALTVLGKYLQVQSHGGQSRRIHTALERLSQHVEQRLHIEEERGPNEQHTSLSSDTKLSIFSVVSISIQRLTETARAALFALSVFPAKPDHFSEEAALFVANCTTDDLDELADAELLLSSDEGYSLHPIIADCAREQLHDLSVYERFNAYS